MFDSVPNKSEQLPAQFCGGAILLKLAEFKLIICILFLLTYSTYYRVSIIAYRYSSFILFNIVFYDSYAIFLDINSMINR